MVKMQISPQIYRPVSQNNLTCEDAEKGENKRKTAKTATLSLSANQQAAEKTGYSGAIIRKERAST